MSNNINSVRDGTFDIQGDSHAAGLQRFKLFSYFQVFIAGNVLHKIFTE